MDSGNHSNVCNHSENQTIKDVSVDKESALSKNCLRKLRHHEQVLQSKRNKRKEKKVLRKQRTLYEKQKSAEELDTFHISKKEEKQMMQHRLMSARGTAQRICVDLGFSCSMSEKELHKLSSQLRRLYGSNRHSQHPLHVFFANFSQESSLYRICREKNQGFEKYVKLSLQAAEQSGLLTARLPIIEWLERGSKGTFSTVLSVNQVGLEDGTAEMDQQGLVVPKRCVVCYCCSPSYRKMKIDKLSRLLIILYPAVYLQTSNPRNQLSITVMGRAQTAHYAALRLSTKQSSFLEIV
ncbi:tRNA methyltransferase 10 homolog B-like isoform X5 [Tachypleus tridentatus]|uniref:tRNA methyltransferase 10 homolog B-like isoform X5 n=1 Tax=Tachypleus tridentatus TaxID=6853 RepID=UPI003FD1C6B4